MSSFIPVEDENSMCSTNLPKALSNDSLKSMTPALKEHNRSSLSTPSFRNFSTPAVSEVTESPFSENFLRKLGGTSLPTTPAGDDEDEGNKQDNNEETEEERRIREEKESELLVWELMRQQDAEMAELQMQFMQENAGEMSEEDYNAMQQIINETPQYQAPTTNSGDNGEGENEEEDGDGNESDDPDNWDYERLLEIGQAIGDVKTERWRMRAQRVLKSLPVLLYQDIISQLDNSESSNTGNSRDNCSGSTRKRVIDLSEASAAKRRSRSPTAAISVTTPTTEGFTPAVPESTTTTEEVVTVLPCGSVHKRVVVSSSRVLDHRCAVCMDPFEAEDRLNLLPCQHYFHIPCTEGWMADHNSCPTCKAKVSPTPEK